MKLNGAPDDVVLSIVPSLLKSHSHLVIVDPDGAVDASVKVTARGEHPWSGDREKPAVGRL